LYGVPTLACEQAEPSPEPTTDDGNEAEGD
jgi:hypothetical protein